MEDLIAAQINVDEDATDGERSSFFRRYPRAV